MRVCDYFNGKNIFLTGGSGFVGKVLIEMLLRTYPGVGKIYILLRAKKGKEPDERLKLIVDSPLFDKIRETNPDVLKKIVGVNGDVTTLNLGMSEEDRRLITSECNIFYHAAASVRFDDSLRYALIMNVRGTRETAKLALECQHLEAFVHISTAFCNLDKDVVEERMYPALADWRDAIEWAEETDEVTLQAMSLKCLEFYPNTYTFAKSLGEHVVEDMFKGKVPTTIVRPSIVVSSIAEPMVGWIDNYHGPVELMYGVLKGVLRVLYAELDAYMDYMPCDLTAKYIILATKEAIRHKNLNEVLVYNATNLKTVAVTMGESMEYKDRLLRDAPLDRGLWYPSASVTKCWYDFYIKVLLYHMLPAVLLDIILSVAGRKPMLVKLQRKIYIANIVLFYFISRSWQFVNERCFALVDTLEDHRDKVDYDFHRIMNMGAEERYTFYRDCISTAAKLLYKEKLDLEKNKRAALNFYILHRIYWTLIYGTSLWLFFWKFNVPGILYTSLENYFSRL